MCHQSAGLHIIIFATSVPEKSHYTRTTETLINVFVTSKLDCGNTILAGLPKHLISRLQTVQNFTVRVVLNLKKTDRIIPALYHLHWPPALQRMDQNYPTHLEGPSWTGNRIDLSDLISVYRVTHSLLSPNSDFFVVEPHYKTLNSYGGRAFRKLAHRL
ncbi:hypothetical protein HOLleu_11304 [Holothuria leucospilota]|uniref:Uncharacterized protein n=1 Tax=Holothuria leucospilota TaxID=206669 RepID=A0A9Q1CF24_HOLLE|nr:hypothetical protein HOLleu_11304 [Holothuria leucospilota]